MPSSRDPLTGVIRARASVIGAFAEGWRRVLAAPALTLGLLAATFAAALPLAMAINDEIAGHLGASLEGARARDAWNPIWAEEFSRGASGLGRTFTHEVLGFGGTLAAVSRLVDAEPIDPAIAAVAAGYVALWVFLSGGVLDRLARGRPIGAARFFAASGGYFVRFIRLGVIVGACYGLLFAVLHPYLFGSLYDQFTRDVSDDTRIITLRVVLYAVFFAALAAVNAVADFTKVRVVVEDRRSVLGALGAALRFIRRRPLGTSALYLLNLLALLVVLRLWMQLAPGAAAPPWLALGLGQLYLAVRLWARLAFIASEVAFFQGELAHAGYAAAPERTWPDSAAAEAIKSTRI